MKWKVFKERLPESFHPMWVVWDEASREYLFRDGLAALDFVRHELIRRYCGAEIAKRQELLRGL